MTAFSMPVLGLLLGPLAGVLLARLAGPVTWSRALLGAAMAMVLLVGIQILRSGVLVGGPTAAARNLGPDDATAGWWTYAVVLVTGAVVGAVMGAAYFGLWRLLRRFAGRNR